MSSNKNMDSQESNMVNYFNLNINNLRLLHCIKSFRNFIKIMIADKAYTVVKTHGELCPLIPTHHLAIWELFKYIHSVFKDTYITLKKIDSVKSNISRATIYNMESSDEECNIGNLFDEDEDNTTTTNVVRKFMPKEYDEIYELHTVMKQKINKQLFQLNINKMDDYDKNNLLETRGCSMDYTNYQKLCPDNIYKPLFTTKRYKIK